MRRLGYFVGVIAGMLLDQCFESSVCGGPVTADLPREGERDVLPVPGDSVLRGIERRLSIAALDLDERRAARWETGAAGFSSMHCGLPARPHRAD